MKNITLEVYSDKSKKAFLAQTMDEAKTFLKSIKLKEDEIDSIINNLEQQRNDPGIFPNVILFLNGKQLISIEEFYKQYKIG